MGVTRRSFLKASGLGYLALEAGSAVAWAGSTISTNDRIRVGVIGCRNKGYNVLREILRTGRAVCLGMCDVDDEVLQRRAAELKKDTGQSPKLYVDFRKMLENPEIDAVIVGSPDHWHCLHAVYAMEAGKDVYVEKPLANSIHECNLIAAAAARYGRVVQVGQQQRSGDVWNGLMDYLKSGALGGLRRVNCWANFAYGAGAPKVPDSAVPEGVDFRLWLGPAPDRTFNASRFHGNWRHFWDYGGGLMTDWGVHLLDMALWAKEVTHEPTKVTGFGMNLSGLDRARETYDTQSVLYQMDDFLIQWQQNGGIERGPYGKSYGVEYVCDKGTVVADREDWTLYVEGKEGETEQAYAFKRRSGRSDMELHANNFIDCVLSRDKPNCSVGLGRNVALYAHFGNLLARTASGSLEWNASRQQFLSNAAANSLIVPEYHRGWKLPVV
ncbi:Oxidoreductase [Lunatimonas lonarensis]|uniref:Oxidoreductase n=1 Tax=Lunatimonas lonarensis TaxID=1232681 RepID=R7ZML4_9BACT|nr:Gfo/Idh/MocA family oxidoreductase [Lunatimonas lonarensis]EON75317.1 Oxidoreductase [Lunatimonas lonarensis]